ncbi:hypothetical protein HMN09_01138100 [Mycena chlorophos]|uniref:Uncharacterized protein n=1 Tax=Mycena chlorophos TaxID=658473 RepID=A0A8H6SAP7_MYCCL|nr:hypothetical protein HMN09_01138100 [Mycena chlorophos]
MAHRAEQESPAYIYYRLYNDDGPLTVHDPCSPINAYIGRILCSSIPPPHTAGTVVRRILHNEGASVTEGALYPKIFAQSALNSGDRFDVLDPKDARGRSAAQPVAVLISQARCVFSFPRASPTQLGSNNEKDYVYYHLYTPNGEAASVLPVSPNQPAVGRIEKFRIMLPHSPRRLRHAIALIEGAYENAEVYENINSLDSLTPRPELDYLVAGRADWESEPADKYINLGGSFGAATKPVVLVQVPVVQQRTKKPPRP